jgi:hypothetical protein
MALWTPNRSQPRPGPLAWTIGIVILIVILVVPISAFTWIDSLPQPYFALGQVVIYAGIVAAIVGKLRTCFRLAQGSEYDKKLRVVVFWVVLGVFSVVWRLGLLFQTENRDYINMATNFALYLALLSALELVALLLKRAIVGSGSSPATVNTTEATTAPNQPLQQTGAA